MNTVSAAEVFLLEKFLLDGRGLFPMESGAPIGIGARALDVLRVLIDRAGDLVSKDEMMSVVWPGTVVEDANLFVKSRHYAASWIMARLSVLSRPSPGRGIGSSAE